MIFGPRSVLLVSCIASLAGCSVQVSKERPWSGAAGGEVVGYDFVASTAGFSRPKNSEPRLLRAAARFCGLPDTQIARETIRHTEAYGIFISRMMRFACPVPERDMK
ncbi:hypothetical protein Q9299_02825 [Gemmobacter fulvus]|uniref:hypothetical protein n=1 Tax=Gemmobacter fulvus TaxID=2840474 RepID=UPI00279671C5|nr:hypothetical protein [Gemmobacter fulvus]MDQ1847211.1 hypothetical protein [Gemmobacter fulvus]